MRTFILTILALVAWLPSAPALEIRSPDGRLTLTFELKPAPVYSLAYRGRTIIEPSQLGLELDAGNLAGLKIVGSTPSRHDATWKPVYGERDTIRDNYRQVVVDLQEATGPQRLLRLTFRLYNEGAAFCYTLPKQPGVDRATIVKEQTEFRFAADHPAWAVYSAQGKYAQVSLSKIKPGCERPLPILVADDCYVALAEARLVDYARMKFAPLAGRPHSLVSLLDGKVAAPLPLTTPWRVVMVADSPGQLLMNNDIILNLNDPCALADTSWIKPGKVIREVTLTTTGGKACVDFAAAHHLQYVEFDAGWYGPENSRKSDASRVTLDPARSRGPLDLQAVIDYGRPKGVGVILYVNHNAMEQQLDEILPLYRRWGVQGVKYGFVNVGSQQWTHWLHEAVRKAAENRLMVDVHDEYRPTGYSRTYPNFMTQEGVSGDETAPANSQTVTLLFARYLAGAADNTICYYDARVDRNASHAYQLAKAVCLYSPWQFLYWYDRPRAAPAKVGGAGKAQSSIGDEPELEFYDRVPTVWDDTRVLHGRIGQYAAIARRSGDAWFLGVMNSGQQRTLDLPLGFLEQGKAYVAHVCVDDPTAPTRTHVRIDRLPVTAATVLKARLSAQGGEAIRIVPAAIGGR